MESKMRQSNIRVRRAFLAAPATVSLDVLKDELRRRTIQPVTACDLPLAGRNVLEHIQRGIRDSDLVIAVLVSECCFNVIFEIGLAYGLNKSMLILVSPTQKNLPIDIAGQLCVRADPENRQAIGFALDQLLAGRGQRSPRAMKPKSTERPLGNAVQRYMRRLQKHGSDISGQELEALVVEVLKAGGVTAVTQRSGPQEGADIAVWSDDLQCTVGNPLIIEVKSHLRSKEQFQHALEQIDRYRQNSNSQWALLLTSTASESLSGLPPAGAVLVLTMAEFLRKLRDKKFSEIVRELCNARVHGAGS